MDEERRHHRPVGHANAGDGCDHASSIQSADHVGKALESAVLRSFYLVLDQADFRRHRAEDQREVGSFT